MAAGRGDSTREERHRAAVALGANVPSAVGGPRETIAEAVRRVGVLGEVSAVSALRETEPEGPVREQPRFLNGALLLWTEMEPEALLQGLLEVERGLGRVREGAAAKGPRAIDLDLLFYDDAVMERPGLTLPHPMVTERRFVLEPLREIAPEWRHPVLGTTAAEMLAKLER